jgi:hydroxypyruvate isomerase
MKKDIDRLSVCIETVFPHTMPYTEQIKTCAELGFKAYEFWYYDLKRDGKGGWLEIADAKDLDLIHRLNQQLGMKLVTFTLNSPHADHGGTPVNDKGTDMMLRTLEQLIPVAQRLGVLQLITFVGHEVPGEKRTETLKKVTASLRKMDRMLDGTGLDLTIEPLSLPKYKGVLLSTIDQAGELCREVGGKHIKLLYDVFHIQIMTGNILATLERYKEYLGHIHISGIPGQHEPAEGELNLPLILKKLAAMGYKGYYGLEYYPLGDPAQSLRESIEYLKDVGGV